jgi:ATP-dependent Clp protease protease subunit
MSTFSNRIARKKKTENPEVKPETTETKPAEVPAKPEKEKKVAEPEQPKVQPVDSSNPMFVADALNIFMDNFFVGQRAIWILGEIGDIDSTEAIRQLNYWNDGSKKPVYIFLNSPGGNCVTCLSIIDSMNALKAAGHIVYTINVGACYSAAATIFTAGSKGYRYAYPSSRLMFHQSRYFGLDAELKADDLELFKKELEIFNANVLNLIAEATGKTKAEIKTLLASDTYISAQEAKKKNIVDKIKVLTLP